MTININGVSSPKVHGATDDNKLRQLDDEPSVKAESGKSTTADTVSLSDNAVQLGKLENSAVAAPVVDTKRVEQVKQAISNGTYEVDAAKVADKLMQFESILKSEK